VRFPREVGPANSVTFPSFAGLMSICVLCNEKVFLMHFKGRKRKGLPYKFKGRTECFNISKEEAVACFKDLIKE